MRTEKYYNFLKWRKDHRLTQKQVYTALGISQGTWWKLERSGKSPPLYIWAVTALGQAIREQRSKRAAIEKAAFKPTQANPIFIKSEE